MIRTSQVWSASSPYKVEDAVGLSPAGQPNSKHAEIAERSSESSREEDNQNANLRITDLNQ